MSVRVITPPLPWLDLATAKTHLVVTHALDDTLIQGYINAACAAIDGPDTFLNRAIGPQTLELRTDDFRGDGYGVIRLPCPPLIDILSVTYLDASGVERTVTADTYDTASGPAIRPAFGKAWPTAAVYAEAVRIRYRAGYAVDSEADPLVSRPPAPIVTAALLMVGDLYANRESVVTGTIAAAIPMSVTVETLLAPFRAWSV